MSSLEIDYHIWQSTCGVYTFVDLAIHEVSSVHTTQKISLLQGHPKLFQ